MTKQDLQQLYWTKKNIKQLEDRLLELETEATRVTTQLTKDPKGPRQLEDKQSELVIRIIEVQDEINRQLETAYEHMAKIEKVIENLPAREAYLIRLRYLELKRWEEICVEMNYSWKHIHRIHSDALMLLAKKDDTK